jgi:hypothetical protein
MASRLAGAATTRKIDLTGVLFNVARVEAMAKL